MQIKVEIGFEQLIDIIKRLPANKLSLLKDELGKHNKTEAKTKEMESFLLNAPTFTKAQIATITKTRKAINQWRQK
jgi:hypothetical protein